MLAKQLTRSGVSVPNMPVGGGWAKTDCMFRYSTLDPGDCVAAPALYRNDCCEISLSSPDPLAHFDSAKRSRKLFLWFDGVCEADGGGKVTLDVDDLCTESETGLLVCNKPWKEAYPSLSFRGGPASS